jgi:hypothetical protein
MTKAIWILIIFVAGYIGYRLFQQWDQARLEHDGQKKAEAAAVVTGESLAGMRPELETGLRTAKDKGAMAFRAWFNANEKLLADPRKAWIELELCVAMSRENPSEAKKIFAGIKSRVPPSSPVWTKMKDLEKTME